MRFQRSLKERNDMNPVASVIVPHYNDIDNLMICLRLLCRQTVPRDAFEIIVVDNNSRIGLKRIQEEVGDLARVVNAQEQGAGAARNYGISLAASDKLAFIDSDCVPTLMWLECGLRALEQADIVGGEVQVLHGDPMRPAEAFEVVFAFQNERYIKKKGFSGSGNLFTHSRVLTKVGGFKTGLSEDVEWCHRARQHGFEIRYEPGARVGHPARRTWSELKRKWQRLTVESYRLARENDKGEIFRWWIRSFVVLLSPFVHWIVIIRTRKLEHLKDRLGALWVLFAIRMYRFYEAQRLVFGGAITGT